MSTASMQQSSAKVLAAVPVFPFLPASDGESAIDHLVATSDIRPDDHVMVIGRKLSSHLIAMAHRGCLSATGVDPSSLYMSQDAVDVVWVVGDDDLDPRISSVFLRIDCPRMVTVELPLSASLGKLQPLMCQLRDRGLAWQSCRRVSGRFVLSAHRAEGLRWAA